MHQKKANRGVVIILKIHGQGVKAQTRTFWVMSRILVLEAAKRISDKKKPGYMLVLYRGMEGSKEKLLEQGDKRLYMLWMKEKNKRRKKKKK